ncbi:MAG: hypothetical protein AAF802_19335 [Planctomycetota bacterium]
MVGNVDSEDDDWLNLDDSPTSPTMAPSETVATAPDLAETMADGPTDAESPFVEDDDPFVTVDESDDPFSLAPPAPRAAPSPMFTDTLPQAVDSEDLFANLPDADQDLKEAASVASNESYRVRCPICETVLYATADKQGQTIHCSDCLSDVKVPPPPKGRIDNKPTMQGSDLQLGQVSESRPADPYRTSAKELLEKASEEPKGPEFTPAYDSPDVAGWFKSIFSIFKDLGVLLHFFALSLFIGVPAAIVASYPWLMLGLVPITLIGTAMTVCCAFAILYAVANQHEQVDDWPVLDPAAWMENIVLVLAATGIAVGPASMVVALLGAPAYVGIAFVFLFIFVGFAPILLSMLDGQSITTPFSPAIGRSITRCQDDWGAFYFSSGLAFLILYVYFFFCDYSPSAIAIGVTLTIGVVFIYFAMIGRLALAISEVVDLSSIDSRRDEESE